MGLASWGAAATGLHSVSSFHPLAFEGSAPVALLLLGLQQQAKTTAGRRAGSGRPRRPLWKAEGAAPPSGPAALCLACCLGRGPRAAANRAGSLSPFRGETNIYLVSGKEPNFVTVYQFACQDEALAAAAARGPARAAAGASPAGFRGARSPRTAARGSLLSQKVQPGHIHTKSALPLRFGMSVQVCAAEPQRGLSRGQRDWPCRDGGFEPPGHLASRHAFRQMCDRRASAACGLSGMPACNACRFWASGYLGIPA